MVPKLLPTRFTIIFFAAALIGCKGNDEAASKQVTPPVNQPVEEVCTDKNTGDSLNFTDALVIAESSQCLIEGQLKETHYCNENSGTWWIDLEAEKPGCNPACVVDLNSRTAEINWRCTGALPPD